MGCRKAQEVFVPSEDCCMEHHYYVEARRLSDGLEDTEGIVKPW